MDKYIFLEPVINRYSREFDVSRIQAEKHFSVLLDFLSLASKSESPCFPDKTIDNAWHTFVLHTRLYADYCFSNFNRFIHHNPIDKIERPIEGYLCAYDFTSNSLTYKLTQITQAVCDGGGGNCSSCTGDSCSSEK